MKFKKTNKKQFKRACRHLPGFILFITYFMCLNAIFEKILSIFPKMAFDIVVPISALWRGFDHWWTANALIHRLIQITSEEIFSREETRINKQETVSYFGDKWVRGEDQLLAQLSLIVGAGSGIHDKALMIVKDSHFLVTQSDQVLSQRLTTDFLDTGPKNECQTDTRIQ